jgi:hypothetical protein
MVNLRSNRREQPNGTVDSAGNGVGMISFYSIVPFPKYGSSLKGTLLSLLAILKALYIAFSPCSGRDVWASLPFIFIRKLFRPF